MNGNEKYKIEDFWPDAEKMLDQHFKTKSRFGFKTGFISLLVLLVSVVSAWYFFTNVSKENKVLVANKKSNTKLITEQSIASHNNAESTENTNQPLETVSSSNLNTISNATGNLNNVNKAKTITPLNGVGSSASTITADESSSNVGKFNSETIKNRESESSKWNEKSEKTSLVVNTTNNTKGLSPADLINDKNSSKRNNNIEELISGNKSTSLEKPISGVTSSEKLISKTTSPKKSTNKANIGIAAPQQSAKENEIVWLSPLKPNLSQDYPIAFNARETLLDTEFASFSKSNKKPNISYQIGGGLFSVSKTLISNANPEYVNRREAEESTANYVSWMLGTKIQFQRFALNPALEFNKYGEKVTYSNYLFGNSNSVTNSWNYNADSITTVSNYYIEGNEYDQTNVQVFTDSTLVSDTTIVYGQKNADVSGINSKTMISYFEIPLVIEYEAIKTKRFSAAIRTGVSVGIISQRRGFYLDTTQEEFRDLNNITTFRSTVWNARIGADFSYFIVPKTSIFIRPEYRTNLQSIFKTEAGIQQKYRAFGVMFGLSKSF